mgnify:CR=1 FL=1
MRKHSQQLASAGLTWLVIDTLWVGLEEVAEISVQIKATNDGAMCTDVFLQVSSSNVRVQPET